MNKVQKMIYVRDEDAVIFDKAIALGGESISKIIVEALKKYINEKEGKQEVKIAEIKFNGCLISTTITTIDE
jgi:metal-responsive CopG/Arc/MetJ family transcriptional regulator